jgi:membrane protein DedA with SNARE-associated domain/rhodanese-related sulfurtransferase
MESLLSGLSQHGYSILMAVVFLEAIGLPAPAALALLIGGGTSASGSLNPWLALGGALAAMLVADTLMFLVGRHTGWWLLGMLCRLSLNPESCILRSADSFYRRGRRLLLFAKFIPGINTMAPPLAGSMNMRLTQFLRLDFVGATFYIGTWFGVGFLFSGALAFITRGYHIFGEVAGWAILAAILGYLGFRIWTWRKSRAQGPVPLVRPEEVASAISAHSAVVYDVRSHGYYESNAMRIQGSQRLEPNAIHQPPELQSNGKHVYLYCTCIREATSSRVARELMESGVSCSVIEGGLRAWKKAGLPMEHVPSAELVQLPVFET